MHFTEEPVIISGYPMPPSDNALKTPAFRYAKGSRKGSKKVLSFIDSPKYIAYKSEVNLWYMQFNLQYAHDFDRIRSWVGKNKMLGMVADWRVHHETLWTQEGRPQRIDETNYLKALRDTFSDLVGFDDKFFFRTDIEKVEIPLKRRPCFYMKIGPIIPRREHW